MKAKKYLTTANTANTAEKHGKNCLIVPYLLLLYTYFFALIAGFAVLKQVLDSLHVIALVCGAAEIFYADFSVVFSPGFATTIFRGWQVGAELHS